MSKCYKCGDQWTNENNIETPLLCLKCSFAAPAGHDERPIEIPGKRLPCPHCGSGLLWSEDRGAHCDGCDGFDPETDLTNDRYDKHDAEL